MAIRLSRVPLRYQHILRKLFARLRVLGLMMISCALGILSLFEIVCIFREVLHMELDVYYSFLASLSLTDLSMSTGFNMTLSGETLCCPVRSGIF
ncbi:MAG: hypothetical protein KBS96_04600, partial [Lachnospiraceae bacterium]|nr:hypothetical protein [Candidatus Colinaster scatohippi]